MNEQTYNDTVNSEMVNHTRQVMLHDEFDIEEMIGEKSFVNIKNSKKNQNRKKSIKHPNHQQEHEEKMKIQLDKKKQTQSTYQQKIEEQHQQDGMFGSGIGAFTKGMKTLGGGIGDVANVSVKGGIGAIKEFGSIAGKGVSFAGKGIIELTDNQLVKSIGSTTKKGIYVVTDNAFAKGIGTVAVEGFSALRGGLEILGIGGNEQNENVEEDTEEHVENQELYLKCKDIIYRNSMKNNSSKTTKLLQAQKLKHIYRLATSSFKISRNIKDAKIQRILLTDSISDMNKVYLDDFDEFFKNEEQWDKLVKKKKVTLDFQQKSNGDYEMIQLNGKRIDKNEISSLGGYYVPWPFSLVPKIPKENMISYKSKQRRIWEIMVLVLAIYNSTTIPLEISFEFEWQKTTFYKILDNFIDFIFLIDMISTFRTSFLTHRGQEEFDSHQIFMRYITMKVFYFDVMALLGSDVIISRIKGVNLKFLGFGKMIRIGRFGQFIDGLNFRVEIKSFVLICKTILFISLFLHIVTCTWVSVVDINKNNYKFWPGPDEFAGVVGFNMSMQWYPPLEDINYVDTKYFTQNQQDKYWYSFYYGVLIFGYNDLFPRNEFSYLCLVINIIGAVMFMNFIVGDIAIMIANLQSKATSFQYKYDETNNVMLTLDLDEELKFQIREYFFKTQNNKDLQQDFDTFMDLVPQNLKETVQEIIFTKNLKENKIISRMIKNVYKEQEKLKIMKEQNKPQELKKKKGLFSSIRILQENMSQQTYSYVSLKDNGFVRSLLSKLGTCLTVPEETIIKQGTYGNELFYISIGDCIVNQVDQSREQHEIIRLLTEGDHFGEICLLYKCQRTCSVISRNYNTMARLEYQSFRSLINQYPDYKKMLIKAVHKYNDLRTKFLKKLVLNLDYSQGLSDVEIYRFIFSLQHIQYQNGDIILKINDKCTELIFIEHGTCEIFTEFEGNEFVFERLTQGYIINSRSFFFEDTMQVNIRCDGQVNLLKIHIKKFEELCNDLPDLSVNVLRYQQKILRLDKKFPLDFISCTDEKDSYLTKKTNRQNILKNVVLQIITQKRFQKRMPKLKDFLELVKNSNKYQKNYIINKIKDIYSGKIEEYQIKEDIRFEKLMEMLHRSNTIISSNNKLLELNGRTVDKYTLRKDQRWGKVQQIKENKEPFSSSLRNLIKQTPTPIKYLESQKYSQLRVNQIGLSVSSGGLNSENDDDFVPGEELSINKKLLSQIKKQRQRMSMLSDIDVKTIVRCEFEDEEKQYESYYGKIAGRSKANIHLGAINCEMLKPFKREKGKYINQRDSWRE